MPPDDTYAQGLAEIEALRARIAHIEDIARQPRPGLGDAIADAMSSARQPVDRKTRDLRNAAHGFAPDLQAEAALAARSADPQRFDADYQAMGGDALTLALYAQQRAAAIATGTWTPPTPEGDPKP